MKRSPKPTRAENLTSKAKEPNRRPDAARRAAIFRNGSNQAVRLPQELRFPLEVREVDIRKYGEDLILSPVRPDWASFFALTITVPEDFLLDREDEPPQERAFK
jgi:antitoxin VapB